MVGGVLGDGLGEGFSSLRELIFLVVDDAEKAFDAGGLRGLSGELVEHVQSLIQPTFGGQSLRVFEGPALRGAFADGDAGFLRVRLKADGGDEGRGKKCNKEGFVPLRFGMHERTLCQFIAA